MDFLFISSHEIAIEFHKFLSKDVNKSIMPLFYHTVKERQYFVCEKRRAPQYIKIEFLSQLHIIFKKIKNKQFLNFKRMCKKDLINSINACYR